MDRSLGKEDRNRAAKIKMAIVLLGIFMIISARGSIQAAENAQIPLDPPLVKGERGGLEERKIELEKEEIFGILERPNVIFPIRWKEPEGPHEKVFKLQRSFKEEIFDFVDMETINKTRNGIK